MKRFFVTVASLIAASTLLVACTNPQQVAQNYAEGQLAFHHKDYPAAYQLLLKAANGGNGNAQYAVGYMLYNGLGVQADQSQALTWFKKAAVQGNYRAVAALQRLEQQAEREAYNLPTPPKPGKK